MTTSTRTFASEFAIGTHRIGPGAPVFVIAEAGVAHFGDMALARKLVDMAAAASADAFKIQLFDVDALIARTAPEWRDRLRPRNLSFDQVAEIRRWCDQCGLRFIATAHDTTRVGWLERLDVAAVKIGSGERNNPAFIASLAALGRPVILSTGMYRETDVREALDACASAGATQVALLHCVTCYPTPPSDVNLSGMDRLAEMFPGPVGYSDHTADGLAVLAAVARGARIVEKHITILRDVPNAQDWKVSEGPEGFARLVVDIRRVEQMIGHGRKEPAPSEQLGQQWALKSVVAARDLPAGHVIEAQDLAAKRPAGGFPPSASATLVGRTLVRAVAEDEQITSEHLR